MQAVFTAPQSVGNPIRRGKGGPAGLFEWMAVKHPHIYVSLLIEFLPLIIVDHEQADERVNANAPSSAGGYLLVYPEFHW